MSGTEEQKCTVFVNAEIEYAFFFGFTNFYFLFDFMCIRLWSLETPGDYDFLGLML